MDPKSWTAHLLDALSEAMARTLAFAPNLLGAMLLLVVGWVVGTLVHRLCVTLGERGLELLSRRQYIHARLAQYPAFRAAPKVLAFIVQGFLLLFFLTAAVHALGLTPVSDLVGKFALYLPRVLVSAIILFVGVVVADMARGLVAKAIAGRALAYGDAFSRIVQGIIVLITGMLALEQLGIQDRILTLLFAILAATVLGGAALAFGLGAGPVVRNILASHYLHKVYRAGQRVHIGKHEGRVLEILATHIVLETPEGRVSVPSHQFIEEASTLRPEGG
jgi:small-conductance mechanosensitive channel